MKFYKAGEIPEVPNMYFIYGDGKQPFNNNNGAPIEIDNDQLPF